MPRYAKVTTNDDGWSDWIQPVSTGYKMACCDCGLVHTMDFRIYEGRVQLRASRNNRATAAKRLWDKRAKLTPQVAETP